MSAHIVSLIDCTSDQSSDRATRWPKFTAAEAAELRDKGFPYSIYRPDDDEFRLSLLLQTIEDREHGALTIEQG